MVKPGAEVTVGSVTCRVLRLLGRGKGAYSHLASTGEGEQVVLKQIHHEPCSYCVFGDKIGAELRDYGTLHTLGLRMPSLLASDRAGERLVKEYIPGPTVFSLIEQDALDPAARAQLERMCRTLYANGLNIDCFPTNFVWHGDRLYYVDYECNPCCTEWDFENWGSRYWTRSPEFLEHAARLRTEAARLDLPD